MDKSTKETLSKLMWNFSNEMKESYCNAIIKMSMSRTVGIHKQDLEKIVSVFKAMSSDDMAKNYMKKIEKLFESK
jgi:hypothetical protein